MTFVMDKLKCIAVFYSGSLCDKNDHKNCVENESI